MIRLVIDNGLDPAAQAWAEFEGASMEMQEMLAAIGTGHEASPAARLQQGMTTVRAWKRFFDLMLQAEAQRPKPNEPGDTA
jgi:hypothetical protein